MPAKSSQSVKKPSPKAARTSKVTDKVTDKGTDKAAAKVNDETQEKYRQDAIAAAEAAIAKLAIEPVLIDLSTSHSYTDYLLVASGQGSRGVSAIAEHIEKTMTERGVRTLGKEGLREGNWALLDFGDVVVHVFDQHLREFYDLESLWFDAPRIELKIPPEQRLLAHSTRYEDFSPEERA